MKDGGQTMSGGEVTVVIAAMSVLGVPLALWSGGHPAVAPFTLLTCALACCVLMVQRKSARASRPASSGRSVVTQRRLLFLSAVLWMIFLAVQTFNARWIAGVPDEGGASWLQSSIPVTWLPSVVSRAEAMVVLSGFAGAFTVALLVSSGLNSRRSVRTLLTGVIAMACVAGLFGLAQFFSGTDAIYWQFPRRRHFFSTFYYENHAAQFFYLALAACAGWTAHSICRRQRRLNAGTVMLHGIPLAILFLSTLCTLSRTGIVVALGVLVFMGLYIAVRTGGRLNPVVRLYAVVGVMAFCLIGVILFSGELGGDIRRDFESRDSGQSIMGESLDARLWQWRAAAEMAGDYPVTGIGIGGYRHYLSFYADEEALKRLDKPSAGQVHNDPLQFLCETGGLGGILLLCLLYGTIRSLVPVYRFRREYIVMIVPVLAVLCVHSLWDLPFRNPAVLVMFSVLACAAIRYGELGRLAHSATKEGVDAA